MQDYPVDGKERMSQLHNASKLTCNLPGNVVSPAAHIDRLIYFVDELLQLKSGTYFILECFFQDRPQQLSVENLSEQR